MNKKENQRFLDTQTQMEQVFLELLKEKEPEKITVSEICRCAGIHRTTFYGHYQDVSDLMEKTLASNYQRIMEGFAMEDFDLENGYAQLFRIVKENRGFFLYYLSKHWEKNSDSSRFSELFCENARALQERLGYETLEALYYHQSFFEGGLRAMLLSWCQKGCREEPENMAELLMKEYGF